MAKQIEIRAASSKAGASETKARFDEVKAQLNSDKGSKLTDFDVIAFLLDAYAASKLPRTERSDSPLQKIRDAIAAQMNLNAHSTAEKDGIFYEKRRITSAWLQSATGANHAAIAAVLGEMTNEIDANHNDNNIGENFNRKAPKKHKDVDPAGFPGY
jgi:hypothetical protein